MAGAAPLLAVHQLAKSVPGGRVLFRQAELSIDSGQFVAITGESGVGKSTLLNLIAGLDLADEGTVSLGSVDLASLDDDARTLLRRDTMGFVFQAFHVLPHLTLSQNISLPLILQSVGLREIRERAREALAEVGLGERGGDYPRQLSGGELQRVAIARALIHRPRLILADEPTGNLDPETAARILDLFANRVRESNAAAILVTHSERAAAVADRRVLLTANGLASA